MSVPVKPLAGATGSDDRSADREAATLIARFAARRPLRAAAFIVTLYGDAIVPRGGLVWLGNVIEVCGAVGISETLVRTAVSRLVSGGHLTGSREGRRSYYRLTPDSLTAFEAAAEVIYRTPTVPDDGQWRLLIVPQDRDDEALRQEIAACGYAMIAPGLAARPGPPAAPPPAGLLAFEGEFSAKADRTTLRTLTAEAWGLRALDRAYRAFLQDFRPLLAALKRASLEPELALAARLLLVHDYRHIVLQDPALPRSLLPADFAGAEARRLFARLYGRLQAAADSQIEARFVNAEGPLALDRAALRRRLDGLSASLAGP